ncbi:MAG: hypothetical protein WCK41_07505 [Actinomycetes bacterium]
MTESTNPARADDARVTVRDARPTPSDEELAAIMAAVELAWPRPAAASADVEPSSWRFSGRWWSRPVPIRRDRP